MSSEQLILYASAIRWLVTSSGVLPQAERKLVREIAGFAVDAWLCRHSVRLSRECAACNAFSDAEHGRFVLPVHAEKAMPTTYHGGEVAEEGDIISFAFAECEVIGFDGDRVRVRWSNGSEQKVQADRCVFVRRRPNLSDAAPHGPVRTPSKDVYAIGPDGDDLVPRVGDVIVRTEPNGDNPERTVFEIGDQWVRFQYADDSLSAANGLGVTASFRLVRRAALPGTPASDAMLSLAFLYASGPDGDDLVPRVGDVIAGAPGTGSLRYTVLDPPVDDVGNVRRTLLGYDDPHAVRPPSFYHLLRRAEPPKPVSPSDAPISELANDRRSIWQQYKDGVSPTVIVNNGVRYLREDTVVKCPKPEREILGYVIRRGPRGKREYLYINWGHFGPSYVLARRFAPTKYEEAKEMVASLLGSATVVPIRRKETP